MSLSGASDLQPSKYRGNRNMIMSNSNDSSSGGFIFWMMMGALFFGGIFDDEEPTVDPKPVVSTQEVPPPHPGNRHPDESSYSMPAASVPDYDVFKDTFADLKDPFTQRQ